MHSDANSLLSVEGLNAWYRDSHVLHGMNFKVRAGETITLLGRNGAGKTTTLRAVMGMLRKRTGSVRFEGRELIDKQPESIARAGIAFCPEERGIFNSLSVAENLMLPPTVRPGGMTKEEIYKLFPNLLERSSSRGTSLSGGEQQMLAIGRILRTGAPLLLLDEPTEGLAPIIVNEIGKVLRLLKQKGFTVVLVEQNYHFATTVADRHYIVENGVVVEELGNDELLAHPERARKWLGV